MKKTLALILAALILSACGGGAPPTNPPPTTSSDRIPNPYDAKDAPAAWYAWELMNDITGDMTDTEIYTLCRNMEESPLAVEYLWEDSVGEMVPWVVGEAHLNSLCGLN